MGSVLPHPNELFARLEEYEHLQAAHRKSQPAHSTDDAESLRSLNQFTGRKRRRAFGAFSKATLFYESPVAAMLYPPAVLRGIRSETPDKTDSTQSAPVSTPEETHLTGLVNGFLMDLANRLEATDPKSIKALKGYIHAVKAELCRSNESTDAPGALFESKLQAILDDNPPEVLVSSQWHAKHLLSVTENGNNSSSQPFTQNASEPHDDFQHKKPFFIKLRPDMLLPWFHTFDDLDQHAAQITDKSRFVPILAPHQQCMIPRPPITLPREWHNVAEGVLAAYIQGGCLDYAYETYLDYHDHIMDPALIDVLITALLHESRAMRAYNVYLRAMESSVKPNQQLPNVIRRLLAKRPITARSSNVSFLTRIAVITALRELRLPHRVTSADTRAGGGGAAPSCVPTATLATGHLPFAESLAAATQRVTEDIISVLTQQQLDLLELRAIRESLVMKHADTHATNHPQLYQMLQDAFAPMGRGSAFTFPSSMPNTVVPSLLNGSLVTSIAHLQLLKHDIISLLVETLLATADALSLPSHAATTPDPPSTFDRASGNPTSAHPPPGRDLRRRENYMAGRILPNKTLEESNDVYKKVKEISQANKDAEIARARRSRGSEEKGDGGASRHTLPTLEDYPSPWVDSDTNDHTKVSPILRRARSYRSLLASPVALLPAPSLPYASGSFVSSLSKLVCSQPSSASEKVTELARRYIMQCAQESYLYSRSPLSALIMLSLDPQLELEPELRTAKIREICAALEEWTSKPDETQGREKLQQILPYLTRYELDKARSFAPLSVSPTGVNKDVKLWTSLYDKANPETKVLTEALSCFIYSDPAYHPLFSTSAPEMSSIGDIPRWKALKMHHDQQQQRMQQASIWSHDHETNDIDATPVPMILPPALIHAWLFDRVLNFDHEAIDGFANICARDGVARHIFTQTAAEILFYYVATAGSVLTAQGTKHHSAIVPLIEMLHGTRLQNAYSQARQQYIAAGGATGLGTELATEAPDQASDVTDPTSDTSENNQSATVRGFYQVKSPLVYSASSKFLSFASLDNDSVFAFPPPSGTHLFPAGVDQVRVELQTKANEPESELTIDSINRLARTLNSLYSSVGIDTTPIMLGVLKRVCAREGYVEGELRAAQLVGALARAGMQDTDSSLFFQASGLLALAEPMPISSLAAEHFILSALSSLNHADQDRAILGRLKFYPVASKMAPEADPLSESGASFSLPHFLPGSSTARPHMLLNHQLGGLSDNMKTSTESSSSLVGSWRVPDLAIPDVFATLVARILSEQLVARSVDRLFVYLCLLSRQYASQKYDSPTLGLDTPQLHDVPNYLTKRDPLPRLEEVMFSLLGGTSAAHEALTHVTQFALWPYLPPAHRHFTNQRTFDVPARTLKDFNVGALSVASRIALLMCYSLCSEPEAAAALLLALDHRQHPEDVNEDQSTHGRSRRGKRQRKTMNHLASLTGGPESKHDSEIDSPPITRIERDIVFATIRQCTPKVVGLLPYLSTAETPSRRAIGLPFNSGTHDPAFAAPSLAGEVLGRYVLAARGVSTPGFDGKEGASKELLPHFEPLADAERMRMKETLTSYLSLMSRTDLLPYAAVTTGDPVEGMDQPITVQGKHTPDPHTLSRIIGEGTDPIAWLGEQAPYAVSISRLVDAAAVDAYMAKQIARREDALARSNPKNVLDPAFTRVSDSNEAHVTVAPERQSLGDKLRSAFGNSCQKESQPASVANGAEDAVLAPSFSLTPRGRDSAAEAQRALAKLPTPLTRSPLIRAVDIAPLLDFNEDLATTLLPPVPKPTFHGVSCIASASVTKGFVLAHLGAFNRAKLGPPPTVLHRLGNLAPATPYLKNPGQEETTDGATDGTSRPGEQQQQVIVSTQQILTPGSSAALSSPLMSLNTSLASALLLRTKWDRWRSRTARLFNQVRKRLIDEGVMNPDGTLIEQPVADEIDVDNGQTVFSVSPAENAETTVLASQTARKESPQAVNPKDLVLTSAMLEEISMAFDGVDRGTDDRPKSPLAHFLRKRLSQGLLDITPEITAAVNKEVSRLEAISTEDLQRSAAKRLNRDLTTLLMFKKRKTAQKQISRTHAAQNLLSTTASSMTTRRTVAVRNTSAADTFVAFIRRLPESHSIASSLVWRGIPHDSTLPKVPEDAYLFTSGLRDLTQLLVENSSSAADSSTEVSSSDPSNGTCASNQSSQSSTSPVPYRFTRNDALKRLIPLVSPPIARVSNNKSNLLALYFAWKQDTQRILAASTTRDFNHTPGMKYMSLEYNNSVTFSLVSNIAKLQSHPLFVTRRSEARSVAPMQFFIRGPHLPSIAASSSSKTQAKPSNRFKPTPRKVRPYCPAVYVKPWQRRAIVVASQAMLRADVAMFKTRPAHGTSFTRIRWLNESYMRSRLGSKSTKITKPLKQFFKLRPYPSTKFRSAASRMPRNSGVLVDQVDGERTFYAGRQ